MSIPSDCCTPCSTTQLNSVPGAEGDPGINAFSITAGAIVVPAPGADIAAAVTVDSTEWMVEGMNVIVGQGLNAIPNNPGPITCRVKTIVNSTQVILTYLGYPTDNGTSPIGAGAVITPAGVMLGFAPLTVYASGTVATLLETGVGNIALLDFGTQDPTLVISAAGTYLLLARVSYKYVGATPTGAEYVRTRLYRTNNGAAEITGTSVDHYLRMASAAGDQGAAATELTLPPVVYTTTNSNDSIDLQAIVSAGITGTVTATSACIIAVRLY